MLQGAVFNPFSRYLYVRVDERGKENEIFIKGGDEGDAVWTNQEADVYRGVVLGCDGGFYCFGGSGFR